MVYSWTDWNKWSDFFALVTVLTSPYTRNCDAGYRKELRKDGIVCISKPANLYSHLLADSSLLDWIIDNA